MRKLVNIALDLKHINILLIAFSVIYYGIVIFLASKLNVWEDEVYSLHTTSTTLQYAYHQSFFFEAQPPVYFLVLTLWRFVSHSILWSRLLNIIFILTAQILLYKFAIKVSDRKIATIVSILFLLNPTTVFVLMEIRLFALILLLSLAIIISFYNVYYRNDLAFKKRILFVLLAIAGLFTQYYFGFLLAGFAVALFFGRERRSLVVYILDMILPLCLVLLFIPKILANAAVSVSSIPVYSRTFSGFFFEVKELISQVSFSYFLPLVFFTSKKIEWIFRGAIIILFFFSLNYSSAKTRFQEFLSISVISLITFFFFVLVDYFFGRYAAEYKYTLLIFIPLLILWLLLFNLLNKKTLNFWMIIMVFIYLGANFNIYHELYKHKDYKSLGSYLEKNDKGEIPVFVYRNISADNLAFYYNGKNKIYPIPEAFSYDLEFGPDQWEIDSQDLIGLNNQLMSYPGFYIVLDDTALAGYSESKKRLLDFLILNYSLKDEKTFKGKITLYFFSPKSN